MERKSLSVFDWLVLVLTMAFPTLLTFVYFVLLNGSPGEAQKAAFGFGKVVQFMLPVVWVALVCRKAWMLRPWNSRGVGEGVVFGLLVFTAMIALYLAWLGKPGGPLGDESFARSAILDRISGFGLTDGRLYLLLGLFYSLIHSGLEEYYWRWFVFGRLSRAMPWKVASTIAALGFMAHHVIILGTYFGYTSPYCWFGSLGVAVGGFYWNSLYRRSDSIWGPWISHGIIDAAIFTIGFFIVTGN